MLRSIRARGTARPVGDVARVELDRMIEVADPRHPVAQDLLGPVGVVVGADVEDDRGFRVIERLDALEIERQRRLLLLGQDRHQDARGILDARAQRALRHERVLLDQVLGAERAEVRRLRRRQLVGGEARVGGDTLDHGRRQFVACQQLQPCVERFAVGAGPIGVDGELVENAVVVDPGLNEEPVRLRQVDAAAREFHAFGVLALARGNNVLAACSASARAGTCLRRRAHRSRSPPRTAGRAPPSGFPASSRLT